MWPFRPRPSPQVHEQPAHRKVAVLAIILLVLMGVVGAVGAVSVASLDGDLGVLVTDDGRVLDQLQSVHQLVIQGQLALERAANASSSVRAKHLRNFDDLLGQASAQWSATVDEPALAASASDRKAFDDWVASASKVRQQLTDQRVDADLLAVTSSFDSLLSTFEHRITPLARRVDASADDALNRSDDARRILLVVVVLGLALGLAVSRSTFRAASAQHTAIELRDAELAVETARTVTESRVARAFEFARSDHDALRAAEQTLRELYPERPSELLLADSSRAHIEVGFRTHAAEGLPGCGVATPSDCPAVAKGHMLTFETSERFDSCPYLRGRPGGAISAVCVPVSISGMSEGVLHSTGVDGETADPDVQRTLELVAARAGDRIGVLRAFNQSAVQAATDPLTGLANRRSFESQAAALLRRGSPVVFAFGDLDHFKVLNDTHGHDTGDRALRTFARTFRQTVRPSDLVARWGGEEFVAAFPDADVAAVVGVLERVQTQLASVVAGGSIPPFTASFGVADHLDGDDLESMIGSADRALLKAKRDGRDRIVLASDLAARPVLVPSEPAGNDAV